MLQNAGLTEEESFLVGSRRLGGADRLRAEFEKGRARITVNERLRFMAYGAVLFSLATGLSTVAGRALLFTSLLVGPSFGFALLGGVLLHVAVIAGIIWLGLKLASKPRTARPVARTAALPLIVMLWFVVSPLASMGLTILMARYVTPGAFSSFRSASLVASMGASAMLPLALVVCLFLMRERSATARA
jgi:hypothetical protein